MALSNNRLNDDGIIMIAQSLCKQSNLNLQSNNITTKAAESLTFAISNKNVLRIVSR